MHELRSMKIIEDEEDFNAAYGGTARTRFRVISEEHSDLFIMPRKYFLAHCGVADLDFRRSIAWVFNKLLGKRTECVIDQSWKKFLN